MLINIDLANLPKEERKGDVLLEPGEPYHFTVVGAVVEEKESKKAPGTTYEVLRVDLAPEEVSGKRIFHRFTLTPNWLRDSSPAKSYIRFAEELGLSTEEAQDTENLKGRSFLGVIAHRAYIKRDGTAATSEDLESILSN